MKYLKTIVKILISAIALYFVFTKIPFTDVWKQIKNIHLWIIVPGLILFAISKIVAAFRLLIYFREIRISISAKTNLKLYLLGMFYNLFLPGGIGGDGYKIYWLKKQGYQNVKHLVSSVLIDRLSGLHALFCLLVIAFVFCDFKLTFKYVVLLLLPLSYILYSFFIQILFPYLKNSTNQTFLYSLGVQVLQLLTAYLLLIALGENSRISSYLFLFLLTSVVAVLPLTIGGIGGREITALVGAEMLNLNTEIAIALSLYFYIVSALVSFTGIYYFISPLKSETLAKLS